MFSPENKLPPHPGRLFCFLVTLFILGSSLKGQQSNKTSPLSTIEISANQLNQLSIKYNPNQVIYSFLVLITDPEGNNIFLESKNRFTGSYLKMIDLSAFKKGEYSLTIICDEEKLNKKILIK